MTTPPQRGHPRRHSSPISIGRGVYPEEVANQYVAPARANVPPAVAAVAQAATSVMVGVSIDAG